MNTASLGSLTNQEFVEEVAITWQKSKAGDYDNDLQNLCDQITPLAKERGISFNWIVSYNLYCNHRCLGLPGSNLIKIIVRKDLSELKKVGVIPNPDYHNQVLWSHKYPKQVFSN